MKKKERKQLNFWAKCLIAICSSIIAFTLVVIIQAMIGISNDYQIGFWSASAYFMAWLIMDYKNTTEDNSKKLEEEIRKNTQLENDNERLTKLNQKLFDENALIQKQYDNYKSDTIVEKAMNNK